MVAMLRGGGVMLPKPRAVHTKELMAASNLSGLTACSHAIASHLLEPTAAMQLHSGVKQKDPNGSRLLDSCWNQQQPCNHTLE